MLQLFKKVALTCLPEFALAPLKDWHYARAVANTSINSEPEFGIIARLVGAGDFVIDIGAHVGCYTKILSELVGPSGHVLAFEPIPLTYRFLSANIIRFSWTNVESRALALSDRAGETIMQVMRWEQNADGYYFARIAGDPANTGAKLVRVTASTLDREINGSPRQISFIKVDVEGHELRCVQGAQRSLQKYRPALMIEVSSDPDLEETDAHRLFAVLAGLGYSPHWYDGEHLRKRRSGDRSVNYFFLQEDHVSRVASLIGA